MLNKNGNSADWPKTKQNHDHNKVINVYYSPCEKMEVKQKSGRPIAKFSVIFGKWYFRFFSNFDFFGMKAD